MSAVRAIIAKWSTPAEFGRAIGLTRNNHAHLMKMRMSIPVSRWSKVVAAAKEAEIKGVTLETLMAAHAADAPLRNAKACRRKQLSSAPPEQTRPAA